MRRYSTEIVIPPDRYVCLRLPDDLPEGRAVVTVVFAPEHGDEPGAESVPPPGDSGRDDDDFEWWDEFEEAPGPAR